MRLQIAANPEPAPTARERLADIVAVLARRVEDAEIDYKIEQARAVSLDRDLGADHYLTRRAVLEVQRAYGAQLEAAGALRAVQRIAEVS